MIIARIPDGPFARETMEELVRSHEARGHDVTVVATMQGYRVEAITVAKDNQQPGADESR